MTEGYRHDPVSALSEAEATGETAALFADIRKTMQLPLLTSIWRILAGIEGGLSATWRVTKPVFETGQPAAVLSQLPARVVLPVPEPLVPGQLACAGMSADDLAMIRAILGVYNRSNSMNLLALTSLIVAPAGSPSDQPPPVPPVWPALPPLLTEAEMGAETWTLLQHLNRFGADPTQPGLATVWRHLAHWPGLLAVVHAGLAPLQQDGTIQRSIQHVLAFAQEEGARLAYFRPESVSLPASAHAMIAPYVLQPGLVARMVAIGHGLARWLEPMRET